MIVSNSGGDHTPYLAMLGRMIRAAGRRMATADPHDLTELVALRAELDRVIDESARAQHAAGFSWTEIGQALGVSRQAARQRWGGAE